MVAAAYTGSGFSYASDGVSVPIDQNKAEYITRQSWLRMGDLMAAGVVAEKWKGRGGEFGGKHGIGSGRGSMGVERGGGDGEV